MAFAGPFHKAASVDSDPVSGAAVYAARADAAARL